LVAALNWHSPRVHEHEATGAIGVLDHARRKTRLTKRGRLLIRLRRRQWGWACPNKLASVEANTPLLGMTCGNTEAGTLNNFNSDASKLVCN